MPNPAAPRAARKPYTSTCHGITREDPYFWLRADNWQELFETPERLDPAIKAYLDAENAWFDTNFAKPTTALRETIFQEIKGRIKDSDYPKGAGEAGLGGTVGVRFQIEADGRVSGCAIEKSSGSKELDDTTCRLIVERFRFRPSLDPSGRPVPATMIQNHIWVMQQLLPDEDDDQRGR